MPSVSELEAHNPESFECDILRQGNIYALKKDVPGFSPGVVEPSAIFRHCVPHVSRALVRVNDTFSVIRI